VDQHDAPPQGVERERRIGGLELLPARVDVGLAIRRQIGAALLSAAAETTQLAGWAAYDSGLHGTAQMYLIQALRLALAAGDRPLGAEILAAMSHQCTYLGASAEAIDLARAAGRVAADAGVEAIRAEAAVLEAQGYAVAGDERACATALDRAERTLDRADRGSDPQWLRYFDEAYLSAKFGHCFVALGRGELARRFAARSLEMNKRFVRGGQFNMALLARAHALADRLAPHVGLPAVRDFTEQVAPVLARAAGPSPGPAVLPADR